MGYFEHTDLYPPRRYEPRSDRERTDYIMRLLERDPATEGSPAADAADYGGAPSAWPPASESLRGAGVYRREYLPPEPPPDAIRSLGDEMVMLAGGLASMPWRALPVAIRMGQQGIASVRGRTPAAESAINAIGKSFRDRFGRGPTSKELPGALGNLTRVDPQPAEQPEPPHIENPILPPPERWPVSDVLQALGEMQDRLRALGGKGFQSYTKREIDDRDFYVGITSGTRPNEENVARRDARKYPSPNYHPAQLDKSSSRYSAIRGREQNLIDHFRRLGMSSNKRNSIWPKNKLRNYYLRNADEEFGRVEDKKEEEE